eukprot:5108898-Pyramimonas_sp.AAC.1
MFRCTGYHWQRYSGIPGARLRAKYLAEPAQGSMQKEGLMQKERTLMLSGSSPLSSSSTRACVPTNQPTNQHIYLYLFFTRTA